VDLVDEVAAVAGLECLVHLLAQHHGVNAGDGLSAGDGLPRLDGGEVQEVARVVRRLGLRGRVLGHVPLGGFDLCDVTQLAGQVLWN